MNERKKSDSDVLKKGPLAKLHERIQNKYMEMQRKLNKSRSVDSISTLSDEYSFKQNRYSINSINSTLSERKRMSTNSDFGELKELKTGEINLELETCPEKHSIVVEQVNENMTIEEVFYDEASIFEGQFENENDYLSPLPFFDADFKVSCDS